MVLSTALDLNPKIIGGLKARVEHAIRLLIRAHGVNAVAPNPPRPELASNLERAVKTLHITPTLLQSSDRR